MQGSLNRSEKELLTGDSWSISGIVLWEMAKLQQLGRIEIDLGDAEIIRALAGIHAWPITLDISRAIQELDFRGDPADELIAATSLVHEIPLVTRNQRMRASRVVPLAP
ncbi:MAG: PIN domain-containing protein [Gemmatimonadota bacterium]